MIDFCINGRFLTQRITGVQRFAFLLVEALKHKYPSIKVYVPKGNYNHLPFEVEIIGTRQGVLWEQVDLPFFLKKKGKPTLVNLCNVAPLFYGNNVITLHDVAFKVNPIWFGWAFQAYYNFLIPLLIKKAKHIITVSEFSKSEIQKHYKVKENAISVVYNICRITPVTNSEKQPFILFVGSLNPRKNLNTLLKAYEKVNQSIQLYIVGEKEKSFADSPELSKYLANKNIVFKGYVSDEELDNYYKGAQLFVSLSHYEGFNIPVLEALASGAEVLISDIPVHRELYNGVASFANPMDSEEVASKINSALENQLELENKLTFCAKFTVQNALNQFEKALKIEQ